MSVVASIQPFGGVRGLHGFQEPPYPSPRRSATRNGADSTHPKLRPDVSKAKSKEKTKAKVKAPSKKLHKLSGQYAETMDLYRTSGLAATVDAMLRAKNRPPVSKIVSLGLGSLEKAPRDQSSRRMKQLVILSALASHLSASGEGIPIYAQDPAFTKVDEAFLQDLGIGVLRTPSPSDLGDAGRAIDGETLVYSPFLTIAAYDLLLNAADSTRGPPVVIGDDFNALKSKWDRHTAEHRHVGDLIRAVKAKAYRCRAIQETGFWEEADSPFPMALYWRTSHGAAAAEREEGRPERNL